MAEYMILRGIIPCFLNASHGTQCPVLNVSQMSNLACASNFVYHILNCVSFVCSSIKVVVTDYWSMIYDFSSLNTFIYRNFNALFNSISQFMFCNIVAYKKIHKETNSPPFPPKWTKNNDKSSGRSVITWMNLEGILLE